MELLSEHFDQTISTVKGLVLEMQSHTGGRILQLNKALDSEIYALEKITRLNITRIDAVLIRATASLYLRAQFHTLNAYFHASPGLIAILGAIWVAVKFVYDQIKWAMGIIALLQSLKIFDLLAAIWPAFYEARTKFRAWVAQLSAAIGWGVDGLLHLIHATQGFTDMLGGLTGKTYAWMDAKWMEKTGNILNAISVKSAMVTHDPGAILEMFFQGEMYKNMREVGRFGTELSSKVEEGLSKAKFAIEGVQYVVDELSGIQEGMPEVIRASIPQAIWDGLNTFSETINEQILPRIATAERHLDLFDSIFANQSGKLSDIATRLAHPGTNLLGIDQLGDYARQGEEWAIDDVSARLWNDQVNADRDYMQADLNAFAIIDAAATSPLPVIPFMDIESPTRAALHGIVVEPQETWFVGGYKSPY